MNVYETLVPAYGRDYKSKKALLEDFNNDKDFKIAWTGQYTNKADLEKLFKDIYSVNIRYAKLRKIAVLKKVKGVWK